MCRRCPGALAHIRAAGRACSFAGGVHVPRRSQLDTRFRSAAAFTLVELLIVIGIIALLISILLPTIGKALEQAKQIKCASNMRQVYFAMQMYSNENRNGLPIPPYIWDVYNPWGRHDLGSYMVSMGVLDYDNGLLWPYLSPSQQGRYNVFNCPTDMANGDTRVAHDSGSAQVVARNFSYSFNMGLRGNYNRNSNNTWNGTGITWSDIINPTRKIVIIEEEFPNDGVAVLNNASDSDDQLTARHNKRGNDCFADGHVESLHPQDLGYTPDGTKAVNTQQTNLYVDLFGP